MNTNTKSRNLVEQGKTQFTKSIITLSALTFLAAFALVGCNQNTPGNSTETSTNNSSMSGASGPMGGTTNMSVVNSVPVMNTNMPATNNLPDMQTNLPASTNQ